MKITVITVCFNAMKTIERTFQSVINQIEKNFEYLVIDGESTDNTVDLIKKWEPQFEKAAITFRWISEQDSGLYDAMNKGARNAQGDWLVYMNADDEFADKGVINTAMGLLKDDIDVLYSNAIIVDNQSEEKRKALSIDTIKRHLPFIPQSAFIKTAVQRKYEFNLHYKITADYDCYLRMYLAGCNFSQTDYFFSKFHIGGVSNQDEWKTYLEDINVKHSQGILNKRSFIQIAKYIRKYVLVRLKK